MKAWALKSKPTGEIYAVRIHLDSLVNVFRNDGDKLVRVRITEIKPRKRKGKI